MSVLSQISSHFFFPTIIITFQFFYSVLTVLDGAKVSRVPGFRGQFPSKQYAGYITLGNEGNGRYMNYYFATSKRCPSEDPIVFWTTGGSGCLGMNAIIYFHVFLYCIFGPFKIEENPDYIINGVKVSSLVVLDAPVGTGFSYSDNSEDYQTDDSKTIADLYDFFLKWFHEYPEFLSNPLYIIGCSYAGAYVPTLSLEIVKGIEEGVKSNLNFKVTVNFILTQKKDMTLLKILSVIFLFAGVLGLIFLFAGVPFAHRMGLISDKLYEDLRISCQGNYWNSIHLDCLRNMEAFKKVMFNFLLCIFRSN
ncbi:hypothetical protein AMTRI_Chr06g197850 [Amborella trichopoda]